MSKKLRTGVIGSGFMGQLHCKAYAAIDNSEFTGVYDADPSAAKAAADKFGAKAFDDLDELLASVEAVSIAVPTVLHHRLALKCAAAGLPMLIEKPIAAALDEAEEIVKEIEKRGLTSAVGYIERFNPAVIEVFKLLQGKKVISVEAKRMAPPASRANDVSVVFDLMIHDLDIISSIARSEVRKITADGAKLGSDVLNKVNASIEFMNGISVKIASNKVADVKTRTIIVNTADGRIEADLISKRVLLYKGKDLISDTVPTAEEPIKAEVMDFLDAVINKRQPRVSAAASLDSFKLACNIEEAALQTLTH